MGLPNLQSAALDPLKQAPSSTHGRLKEQKTETRTETHLKLANQQSKEPALETQSASQFSFFTASLLRVRFLTLTFPFLFLFPSLRSWSTLVHQRNRPESILPHLLSSTTSCFTANLPGEPPIFFSVDSRACAPISLTFFPAGNRSKSAPLNPKGAPPAQPPAAAR